MFPAGFVGSVKWFHSVNRWFHGEACVNAPFGHNWPTAAPAPGRKTIMKSMKMTRRGLLGTVSGVAAATILGGRAKAAAEFEFKLGTNTPEDHPLSIRANAAAKEIASTSAARLKLSVFP